MSDYVLPLGWGKSKKELRALFPIITFGLEDGPTTRYVRCGRGYLRNMAGDCGTLVFSGANTVNKEDLNTLMQVASHCGFNKIFATITGDMIKTMKEQRDMFKSLGWRCIDSSHSNRSPEKVSFTMFLRIKDPVWKGY